MKAEAFDHFMAKKFGNVKVYLCGKTVLIV